jgi:hypothetical protein
VSSGGPQYQQKPSTAEKYSKGFTKQSRDYGQDIGGPLYRATLTLTLVTMANQLQSSEELLAYVRGVSLREDDILR